MYFKLGHYPCLKGMAKKEQARLCTAALRKYDRWARLRFWLVVFMLLVSAALVGSLAPGEGLPAGLVAAEAGVAGGILFYGYLLWEINGPIYEAVTKFIQNGDKCA